MNTFQTSNKFKNKTIHHVDSLQQLHNNPSLSSLKKFTSNKVSNNPSTHLTNSNVFNNLMNSHNNNNLMNIQNNNNNNEVVIKNLLKKNQQLRKSSIAKRSIAINNVINKGIEDMGSNNNSVKKEFNNFIKYDNDKHNVNNLISIFKHKQIKSCLSTPYSQDTNFDNNKNPIQFTQPLQRNIKTASSNHQHNNNNIYNNNNNNNNNNNTSNNVQFHYNSTGKLHRGKNSNPKFILSKQQRLNPFYEKPQIITQKMINSQGIYNLLSSGLLPKQFNFMDLLNTKYQLIEEEKPTNYKQSEIMKIQERNQNDGFITNPGIISKYYEEHKKIYQEEFKQQSQHLKPILSNIRQQNKIKQQPKLKKQKIKKNKKVKSNSLNKLLQLFPVQIPTLTITSGSIQKCKSFQQFYQKCLYDGSQIQFSLLISKIQYFAKKYNLKKIRFKPQLKYVSKYSDQQLLNMIEDSQILGINKVVRPKNIRINSILMRCISIYKFKILKKSLNQIQNVKKYFRFRKLYHQTIDKRYQFFKYKLGSFAQQQRKYIQSFFLQNKQNNIKYTPKVQIHILSMDITYNQQKTYYKLRQRLRTQLTRIFNMDCTDIVILVQSQIMGNIQQDLQLLIKMFNKVSSKYEQIHHRKPNLHIFQTNLHGYSIPQTARTYFGINQQIIKFIRNLCHNQKPILIPYQSSPYLPLISEILNANLFGGTFPNQTISNLFNQNDDKQEEKSQQKSQRKKFIKVQQKNTYTEKIKKLKQSQLANKVYENKNKTHQIFKNNKKLTPKRISLKNKNIQQFYQQISKQFLQNKQTSKWLLKLPFSTFSRGISILQINDLKIFQQKRKKQSISQQDITQISNLIPIILKDKIILPHSNLYGKKQFIEEFLKNQDSFVEQFVEDTEKICVFGKILPNRKFVFQGSYKKIYGGNYVGFGASYPATQIKPQIVNSLQIISKQISQLNVFGYITFQFLFQQSTNKLYYLDIIPNLDQYSSFYFFYNSLFQSQNMTSSYYSFNCLPQHIFYCPFLDNNGTIHSNIQQFLQQCHNNRIQYNSLSQQGQKFIFLNPNPSVLSVISLSSTQFLSIKGCIQAIAFLIQNGDKFNQFDKKYTKGKQLKMDGLYIMDVIWKLREIKKKGENKMLMIDKK